MIRTLARVTSLRLSLQFALLYASLSAVIFLGAYALARYETRDWVEDRMEADAEALTQLAAEEGEAALIEAVEAISRLAFEAERIFLLVDASGNRLAGNVEGLPRTPPRYVSASEMTLPETADDEVLGYWLRSDPAGELTLIQGTSDHVVFEIVEALVVSLSLGFVLLLIVGTAAGIRVGRLTGDRVSAISAALDRAAAGEMSARVPGRLGDLDDDLGRLAAKVNETLGELEDLMDAQEAVTAQVAHDLRTPMQRLRARIERLEHVDPAARDAALKEVDGILRTFQALLSIAEIGARRGTAHAAPLDVNRLVTDVAETYEPLFEDSGLKIRLDLPEHGPTIRGDRALLVQALANVLENVVAHARSATCATIGVSRQGDDIRIEIADDGDGIPQAQHEAVFRRFHRVDPNQRAGGAGLGLSMVRAIARLHGGEARIVADTAGGTTVEILISSIQ